MRVVYIFALVSCAWAVSVSISLAPGSAPEVTGNQVSLSIEQDRWLDWSGTTSRNTFFFNVLDNLVQITGDAPTVRIGADSEDHTNYNAKVSSVQQSFPPPSSNVPYPEATNIVAGPAFYEAAQFLPPGTGVTWGVNFGGKNMTATFLETKAIMAAFDSAAVKSANIRLDALELGNEADLYKYNGLRSSSYSVSNYIPEWISFATNLTQTAGLDSSNTRLWGAAFAGSSHSTTDFAPQAIFGDVLNSDPGQYITTISQHHYSGSFCAGSEGILQDLMTKATIRSNLSSFLPDIQATQDQGLDYVFGETNSYSCHGAPGVSNTAGAALWTLDYALFASQIGASRVYFHEGIGYKYNLIQPATLTRSTLNGSPLPTPQQPHIQPQYYAAIIAAEAIGGSSKTRTARELNINNSRIAGYAFYEGPRLKRAIFINSLSFSSSSTSRPSEHISLGFTGSGTKPSTFTVKRLVIGHSDDTSGLTWGGQSYETSTGRVSGAAKVETGTVANGVDIPATQVVMLTFA